MTLEDVEFALQHYNSLPNWSLLPGSENIVKRDQSLAEWLAQQSDPALMRDRAILPDVDLGLQNFRSFYEARRQLLVTKISQRLGVGVAPALAENDEPEAATLVTGEAVEI
jgi:hypothetical protein